jgi:hypothetical protein
MTGSNWFARIFVQFYTHFGEMATGGLSMASADSPDTAESSSVAPAESRFTGLGEKGEPLRSQLPRRTFRETPGRRSLLATPAVTVRAAPRR